MESEPNQFRRLPVSRGTGTFELWQLLDSSFPTGGFAHSGGLEAAWNHGAISNRAALQTWVSASLWQAGNGQLPLVHAAFVEPSQLGHIDRFCDAWTTNHVANRASRLQGRALAVAARRAFGFDASAAGQAPPFLHFSPVFGALARWMELGASTALEAFLFMHLRSLVASAVRLNVVGPMEAQSVQSELGSVAADVVRHSLTLSLDDVSQSAPLLDIWQGAHDRLHTRLFQT